MADVLQLFPDFGEVVLGLLQRQRGADTGHDIFALSVQKEVSHRLFFTGVVVSGEGHSGARRIAQVSKNHGLNVHGRTEIVRDALFFTVHHGAGVVPALEDGLYGQQQLLFRVGGEFPTGFLAELLFKLVHQRLQVFGRQVFVQSDSGLFLLVSDDVLEFVLRKAHHHIGEHLDEAPIGVVSETLISRLLGQTLNGIVVEAEVQDSIHHSRHGDSRSRPNRQEQRVVRAAEVLAHLLGQSFGTLHHFVAQPFGHLAQSGVYVADFGGHHEAGGHGKTQTGHLR